MELKYEAQRTCSLWAGGLLLLTSLLRPSSQDWSCLNTTFLGTVALSQLCLGWSQPCISSSDSCACSPLRWSTFLLHYLALPLLLISKLYLLTCRNIQTLPWNILDTMLFQKLCFTTCLVFPYWKWKPLSQRSRAYTAAPSYCTEHFREFFNEEQGGKCTIKINMDI